MTSKIVGEGNEPAADPIEQLASEWIERRDFGKWTEVDDAELGAWLGQSIAHRIAFLRLDLEWKRTERLAALRPLKPHSPSGNTSGGGWRKSLRIAAAVAVLGVMGALGATQFLSPRGNLYTTPVGGQKILTLPDGSRIELNTNTVLRMISDPQHRSATLERGEAYFEIKHDIAHPFVVTAANHKVTDLGTKFLLKADGNKLEVALLEGLAKVEPAGTGGVQHSAVLRPGDIAFALPGSLSVIKKTAATIKDDLGWRRGVVVFRHVTLQDAADEFNRYNTQKILIADPETAHLTFSATLPTHDTQTFVRILGKLFNTRHQAIAEGIVISR